MDDDHRVKPLSFCEIWTDDFPGGVRVWEASHPIFDTTPNPTQGSVGFHVHAYDSSEDRIAGRKAIDDTFETVIIDGKKLTRKPIDTIVADLSKEYHDRGICGIALECPHCNVAEPTWDDLEGSPIGPGPVLPRSKQEMPE